ncbi:adenylate/guanylate cyclase domain-containing protein [soil metagenome]
MSAEGNSLAEQLGATGDVAKVIDELLELGISPGSIRRAYDRDRVEDAIFEAVLDPARSDRTVSAEQIESGGGLTVSELQLIALTFGLRVPEPDEPFFTPEEAAAYQSFGALREVWPPEVYLQITRVYGQALAHIARAEVQAFRLQVEPGLREAADGVGGGLPAVHEAFAQLLPLADPLLLGVHRRRVEHEVSQAAVQEAELRSPSGKLPGAVEVTLAFCDLSDFTAYAEARGDATAFEAIERFATVVTAEMGERGQVLKALGDGYMISFENPVAAVATCARIIKRMRSDDALGVHASVHHGVALHREGDYFGNTVNLAARLLGLAERNQLVVSANVVRKTSDAPFEWESLGTRQVRGLSEPIQAYRLADAAGPVDRTSAPSSPPLSHSR